MPTFEGRWNVAPGARFGIVAARFNSMVTEALVAGCRGGFAQVGVCDDRLDLAWVPGSFEAPLAAKVMAETGRYAAVVCIGCVIRGETGHYDHVAGQSASGVQAAAISTGVPIIYGILTTETVEQALNRSGLKSGNKGTEAALAAVEMADLLARIRQG